MGVSVGSWSVASCTDGLLMAAVVLVLAAAAVVVVEAVDSNQIIPFEELASLMPLLA